MATEYAGSFDAVSVMELSSAGEEAPATEVAFIRGDGSAAVLSAAWSAAKQSDLKKHPRKTRRFYKSQNEMIDIFM